MKKNLNCLSKYSRIAISFPRYVLIIKFFLLLFLQHNFKKN